MDLVSESLQKLEPLPDTGTEALQETNKEEAKWLEEMTERAARSEDVVCTRPGSQWLQFCFHIVLSHYYYILVFSNR